MVDWKICCVAIVAIAGVIGYSLYQGIDGAILSVGIAAIAGIAGYTAAKATQK